MHYCFLKFDESFIAKNKLIDFRMTFLEKKTYWTDTINKPFARSFKIRAWHLLKYNVFMVE